MDVKLKYKCFMYTGKIKTLTRVHKCPDFKEIVHSIDNVELQEVLGCSENIESVDDQIMNFVDEQDKMDWMIENDIQTIIDYWIYVPKTKELKIQEHNDQFVLIKYAFSLAFKDEQMLIDALAVYSQMYKDIKNLEIMKQVKIVINSMSIGYQSQIQAYKYMTDLMQSDSVKEIQEKIDNKNK